MNDPEIQLRAQALCKYSHEATTHRIIARRNIDFHGSAGGFTFCALSCQTETTSDRTKMTNEWPLQALATIITFIYAYKAGANANIFCMIAMFKIRLMLSQRVIDT